MRWNRYTYRNVRHSPIQNNVCIHVTSRAFQRTRAPHSLGHSSGVSISRSVRFPMLEVTTALITMCITRVCPLDFVGRRHWGTMARLAESIGRLFNWGILCWTVAWFSWATGASGIPQEVSISEDAMSASCEGYEHRVVLSSVGFSRGVHYWELTIDRYHSDTDPAFGIARAEVSRDRMLGKLI